MFLVISMFISNLGNTNNQFYECGKTIGNYLIKKGIPLLSRSEDLMLFAKTKELQKAINEMPFYLQILVKGGVING